MVENLLTVTRVDGAVGANLNKVPEAAEEVVAEAVSKFRKRFPERVISASVPDDLRMVPMDAMLIKQVIINLLENVAFHTPPDTRARLTVSRQEFLQKNSSILQLTLKKISRQIILKKIIFMLLPFVKKIL